MQGPCSACTIRCRDLCSCVASCCLNCAAKWQLKPSRLKCRSVHKVSLLASTAAMHQAAEQPSLGLQTICVLQLYLLRQHAATQFCHGAVRKPISSALHGSLVLRLAKAVSPRCLDECAQRRIVAAGQVCAILAKMQLAGVGCQPQVLLAHRSTLSQRVAAINSRAAHLVGRPFNLSSSSQLAQVLYEELRLPPPATTGKAGRTSCHHRQHRACFQGQRKLHVVHIN